MAGCPEAGFHLGTHELPAHDLERDLIVPGARLQGRVIHLAKEIAKNADSTLQIEVSARPKGHDYPAAFRTVSVNSDGTYAIDGLEPGDCVIGVWPGQLVEGQTVEATVYPSQSVVDLDLRMSNP